MNETRHSSGRILKLRYWFFGWWGEAFLPTDVADSWVWLKLRPRWYQWLRHIRLFLGIVWRHYETERIGWSLAWQIAFCTFEDHSSNRLLRERKP